MKTPKVKAILDDPSGSFWLKAGLRNALERSPVDALEDAQRLVEAIEEWCDVKLQEELDKRLKMRGKVPEVGALAGEVG